MNTLSLPFGNSMHRLAVPGVVWGAYPQNEPMSHPVSSRPKPFGSVNKVCALVAELSENDEFDLARIRLDLARHGFTEQACALALACARAHYFKTLGLLAHPNQIRAAVHLLNQQLAELATGEGKTLAVALAGAVAALGGAAVHLLTANDYLAQRDCDRHQLFFSSLGLDVACATDAMGGNERRRAYGRAVCYASARNVAFDYLRDQTGQADPAGGQTPVLRGLSFAIIDEADSILIDEASIPLVLSEQTDDPTLAIDAATELARAGQLIPETDFTIDLAQRQVRLLAAGISKLSSPELAGTGTPKNPGFRLDVATQALTALHVLRKDVDYLVRDGSVVLIDKTTGRSASARVLPGQLHALVCAREGLPPPPASRNRTGLTYPRFFARYHHLCGLSGTLREARAEFAAHYGLSVAMVPRHRPNRLHHLRSRLFATETDLLRAAVKRAAQMAERGRPVLIGTDSVRQARTLARRFNRRGIEVMLLDAASDASEAEQIHQAGTGGRITVSTQIAGRGTDIPLTEQSRQAGGLHVLNLQQNRSPRIDRQMAGRAARQGDPGSAEHWIALDLPRSAAWRNRLRRLTNQIGAAAGFVRGKQQIWQLQDRSQRHKRLRADLKMAQTLHFSTMSHH